MVRADECAICGAVLAGDDAAVGSPVAAVRVFVRDRGLDPHALCSACRCGAVPSPCVSLCTLDGAKERCRGCGRTVTEIVRWSGMTTAERCAVRLRLRSERT